MTGKMKPRMMMEKIKSMLKEKRMAKQSKRCSM
jgi:hypothetical protein